MPSLIEIWVGSDQPAEQTDILTDLSSVPLADKLTLLFAKIYLPATQVVEIKEKLKPKVVMDKPQEQPDDYDYIGTEVTARFKENLRFAHRLNLKGFFGLPLDASAASPLAWLWAALMFLPRILLNIARLLTEIIPGIFVALAERAKEKLTHYLLDAHLGAASNPLSKVLAWAALIPITFILHPLTKLLYFTGRAITSPIENATRAWQFFGDWRDRKNRPLQRTAGYVFGGLAWLFSVAVTITIYTLLAPFVGIGLGLLGAGPALAVIGNVLAPVTNFLAGVIGPAISIGVNYIASQLPTLGLSTLATTLTASPVSLALGAMLGTAVTVIGTPIKSAWHAIKQKLGTADIASASSVPAAELDPVEAINALGEGPNNKKNKNAVIIFLRSIEKQAIDAAKAFAKDNGKLESNIGADEGVDQYDIIFKREWPTEKCQRVSEKSRHALEALWNEMRRSDKQEIQNLSALLGYFNMHLEKSPAPDQTGAAVQSVSRDFNPDDAIKVTPTENAYTQFNAEKSSHLTFSIFRCCGGEYSPEASPYQRRKFGDLTPTSPSQSRK